MMPVLFEGAVLVVLVSSFWQENKIDTKLNAINMFFITQN
jgi:hypothetical protein